MSPHTNGKATLGRSTRPGAGAPAQVTSAPAVVAGQPAPAAAAARRRSRRGLLIAVLVVLLGGVLAFAGASMMTRHDQVLAVARDVPLGQVVTDADVVVVSVSSDPNLAPIPADQRGQVVGLIAQVPLVKGELLTRGQVGPSTGFTAGQQLVALPLKPGQFPARGLSAGDQVLVVATPGSTTVTGNAAAGTPTAGSVSAVVAEAGPADPASGVTVVDVRVAAAEGPDLARLASTGNLAVILLPTAGG